VVGRKDLVQDGRRPQALDARQRGLVTDQAPLVEVGDRTPLVSWFAPTGGTLHW